MLTDSVSKQTDYIEIPLHTFTTKVVSETLFFPYLKHNTRQESYKPKMVVMSLTIPFRQCASFDHTMHVIWLPTPFTALSITYLTSRPQSCHCARAGRLVFPGGSVVLGIAQTAWMSACDTAPQGRHGALCDEGRNTVKSPPVVLVFPAWRRLCGVVRLTERR